MKGTVVSDEGNLVGLRSDHNGGVYLVVRGRVSLLRPPPKKRRTRKSATPSPKNGS
jgi:hypothetical protein